MILVVGRIGISAIGLLKFSGGVAKRISNRVWGMATINEH